ncbi:hypothetical protein KKC13_07195 [bacterium]|nr:hypothetical protein [bacterium]MBU1956923.1 hypothetical protein [bacterium]
MKKLFLLFSHTLTAIQLEDAKDTLGVETFVELPKGLQELWSNVPAELECLSDYLQPIRDYMIEHIEVDDVALVQGDFGATCSMASFVKSLGGVAVYATTKRNVEEIQDGDTIVKRSVFQHVIFRQY